MPRYFSIISHEDLAKEILDAFEANMPSDMFYRTSYKSHGCKKPTEGNRISFIHKKAYILGLRYLTKQVEKDLKVEFDCENLEASPDEAFSGAERICGIRTLPNGLTYFGITAGGDWETPLFFIIYWDGKKLRGYVPTDGNPWNVINKIAYGNDEDQIHQARKDVADIAKRFPGKHKDDIDVDCNQIISDITARILPR